MLETAGILAKPNFDFGFVRMYLQRALFGALQRSLEAFPAVLITGPRQFAPMQQLGESPAERVAILALLPFRGAECERPMPGGHRALPWQAFPAWLEQLPGGTR